MNTSATNLERLAQFKRHTGLVTILRAFDTVEQVKLEDDKAVMKVETFSFDDTTHEYRFKRRGVRMIGYQRVDVNMGDRTVPGWVKVADMTIWDDSFVPFVQAKHGRSVSPREYAEQKQWERDCYRPGTDRQPLDNYSRVLAGPTTPAMERYW